MFKLVCAASQADEPEDRTRGRSIPLPGNEMNSRAVPRHFLAEYVPPTALEGMTRAKFTPLGSVEFFDSACNLYPQSHKAILRGTMNTATYKNERVVKKLQDP